MKKLLLLSTLCVFAQVRTEIPEMTKAQKKELADIETIMPKYAAYMQQVNAGTNPILKRAYPMLFGERSYKQSKNPNKFYFCHKDADTLYWMQQAKKDCTKHSNPSVAKACVALGEMLEKAGDAPTSYETMFVDNTNGNVDSIKVPRWTK